MSSPARGREPLESVNHVTHTGRGGAGNVRSPSREPQNTGNFSPQPIHVIDTPIDECSEASEAARNGYEQKVIEEADARRQAVVRV